jgi:hypothetical protein
MMKLNHRCTSIKEIDAADKIEADEAESSSLYYSIREGLWQTQREEAQQLI